MPSIFVVLTSMALRQKLRPSRKVKLVKKFVTTTMLFIKRYTNGLIVISITSVERQPHNKQLSLKIYLMTSISEDKRLKK